MRERGHSINEIVTRLEIPKTTVWHHVQKVVVGQKFVNQLKSKRGGSKKRKEQSLLFAENQAGTLLADKRKRELLIIIAMLYWAEGSKKVCEFINSDGAMIALYLYVIRAILNVPEESIVPTMRIFTGMDETQCLVYWSKITNIPKRKFKIRLNDGGVSGRTTYGMCRITVKKGNNTVKLLRAIIKRISLEKTGMLPL